MFGQCPPGGGKNTGIGCGRCKASEYEVVVCYYEYSATPQMPQDYVV